MRRRYREEQKREILKDLEKSGLSRAAYCRKEGLCYQSVSKWIGRTRGKETRLALVEVQRQDEAAGAKVTVRVGGSVEVDFDSAVSLRDLACFCRDVSAGLRPCNRQTNYGSIPVRWLY